MKTKFYVLTLALAATTMILATGCEDSDNTKPVIDLIEPADGDMLRVGSDVHFEMNLSDDEALKSYKVEIHHNFDGHGHESRDTPTPGDEEPFAFNRSWEVSGKNAHVHHHEIVIPENARPGDYHLMVYCTDAAGNEAHVARDIVLSHEGGDHDHDHHHE
jgi:hypothetical protein